MLIYYPTSRVVWGDKTSSIYFRQVFFSPLITKPTGVTDHSATLIDNIYCNITEVSTHCKAGILKLSISDHYAIFCICKDSLIGTKNSVITKRHFVLKFYIISIVILNKNHGIMFIVVVVVVYPLP